MALNASFAGKRILVTGGANGLGRIIVQKLHEDKAIVFTIDYDEDALKQLKADFPNIRTAAVDLMDWDKTRAVVTAFGTMDHLVNNAGVLVSQEFFKIQEKDVDRMNGINYKAIINVSQVVAKSMVEENKGGSIVNLASVCSRFAGFELTAYCCTKAAVNQLTKSMALELGPHNIRVNCISPATMDTALARQNTTNWDRMLDRQVLKKEITTSDAADLVLFLLSPLSSMITGENVFIDGGYSTN